MTVPPSLFEAGNQRGFMVFIENENTDAAGHMTDVASVVQAYREFDRSVGLAYEFYRKHPRETLILVTADHDTGGLGFTLALEEPSSRRAKRLAATEQDLKKIASISISLKKAAEILGPNPTSEGVDRLMKENFKGFTLAPDLKKMLLSKQIPARNLYTDPIANTLGLMVANNTQAIGARRTPASRYSSRRWHRLELSAASVQHRLRPEPLRPLGFHSRAVLDWGEFFSSTNPTLIPSFRLAHSLKG